MNSLLQCVSNTMELTDYFVSNEYLRDINPGNPLGAGGLLAHAYGALMHAMWSGQCGRVAPQRVKNIVAKKAPQFMGWGQHDSQEFASFLLDLLLEDLCRVKKKPYVPLIEDKEKEGKSDLEIAERYWNDHKKRNDSKVMDIFAGQYKSRVECNICHTTSLAFDPFTSLSVPIPIDKWSTQLVFWFGLDNRRPLRTQIYWQSSQYAPTGQDLAEWLVECIAYTAVHPDPQQNVSVEHLVINPANVLRNRERARARRETALKQLEATNRSGGAGMEEDEQPTPTPAASGSGAEPKFAILKPGTPDETIFINGTRLPNPWEVLICVNTNEPNCGTLGVVPHWANLPLAFETIKRDRGATIGFVMCYHVPGTPSYAETAASPFAPELHPEYDERDLSAAPSAAPSAAAPDSDDDDEPAPRKKVTVVKDKQLPVRQRFKPRPASPIGPLRSDYALVCFRKEKIDNSYYQQPQKGYEVNGDNFVVPLRWLPDEREADAATPAPSAAVAAVAEDTNGDIQGKPAPVQLVQLNAGRRLLPGQELTVAQFRQAAFRSCYRFIAGDARGQVNHATPAVRYGYSETEYGQFACAPLLFSFLPLLLVPLSSSPLFFSLRLFFVTLRRSSQPRVPLRHQGSHDCGVRQGLRGASWPLCAQPFVGQARV